MSQCGHRVHERACGRGELCRRARLLEAVGVLLEEVRDPFGGDRLWTLQGQAERTIPEQLGKHTVRAAQTEEDRVEVVVFETVILEQHARVGVYVWVRVLGLAVLGQHTRHHLVHGVDHLEERVLREVLESELALRGVARVRLAEDRVTVSGDDLSSLEGVPRELGDGLGRHLLALLLEGRLETEQPAQHLLVGEAVQRPRERVHGGAEREVRIGQSGADQVARVGGSVAALVVRVDDNVQPHELMEGRVVHAKHLAEVGRVVHGLVVGLAQCAFKVGAAVDEGAHLRQPCQ
mmetsp:Transcript_22158/g.71601  ORF Transcript_22158/g.71601 Transcript_22158/m.71601 type:complete len:292 (+) Transcript_22158:619-1494(+)